MEKSKNGFFLTETIVVLCVVAAVLVAIFNIFSSVYEKGKESEKYDTVSSVNAVSAIKQYYNNVSFDKDTLLGSEAFVDLTDNAIYNSDYYTKLKRKLNISKIYLFNMNKTFNGDLSNFDVSFRRYLTRLNNKGYAYNLVVILNNNEYSSSAISDDYTVTLNGGNSLDENAICVVLNTSYVEPGYNWDGNPPTITGTVDTSKVGKYYLVYNFDGYLIRRRVEVKETC